MIFKIQTRKNLASHGITMKQAEDFTQKLHHFCRVRETSGFSKPVSIEWNSRPSPGGQDTYPYFLRTVPPDSIQGQAFWNWIVTFEARYLWPFIFQTSWCGWIHLPWLLSHDLCQNACSRSLEPLDIHLQRASMDLCRPMMFVDRWESLLAALCKVTFCLSCLDVCPRYPQIVTASKSWLVSLGMSPVRSSSCISHIPDCLGGTIGCVYVCGGAIRWLGQ